MASTKFKYHSPWADSLRAEGREEGHMEALRVARKALLNILRERSLEPTDEQRERIQDCTDLEHLRFLEGAAVAGASGKELFGRGAVANAKFEFHSPLADSIRAEGREEGELRAAREAVLNILRARSLEPTDEQRERIQRCTDLDQLRTWQSAAVTAASSDDL